MPLMEARGRGFVHVLWLLGMLVGLTNAALTTAQATCTGQFDCRCTVTDWPDGDTPVGVLETCIHKAAKFVKIPGVSTSQNIITLAPNAFASMLRNKVEVIDLSGNKIIAVNWTTAFAHVADLQTLDLSGNRLVRVEKFPKTMSAMKRLTLRGNQIASIAAGAFEHLTNLEFLDLSSNLLTVVPDVSGLPKLHELNLASNRIADFSVGYQLPIARQLFSLDLSHNLIAVLAPPIFARAAGLRMLSLASNRIYQWAPLTEPDLFTPLIALSTFDLSGNPALVSPCFNWRDGIGERALVVGKMALRFWACAAEGPTPAPPTPAPTPVDSLCSTALRCPRLARDELRLQCAPAFEAARVSTLTSVAGSCSGATLAGGADCSSTSNATAPSPFAPGGDEGCAPALVELRVVLLVQDLLQDLNLPPAPAPTPAPGAAPGRSPVQQLTDSAVAESIQIQLAGAIKAVSAALNTKATPGYTGAAGITDPLGGGGVGAGTARVDSADVRLLRTRTRTLPRAPLRTQVRCSAMQPASTVNK
jgi:hypothetical protein